MLAFGEEVMENITSSNNVVKSMNSPLRMHCCNASGTGGKIVIMMDLKDQYG